MIRTIRRNMLKRTLGTNKIGHTWRKMQIKKYGEALWLRLYNVCAHKLARKEIYL